MKDSKIAGLSSYSRFAMAYDGLHTLSVAVLTHYEVRTVSGEGHRQTALQLLLDLTDLKGKIPGSYKTLMDAHKTRNRLSYDDPEPPPSEAEVDAMIRLLETSLPLVEALVAGGTS